MSMDVILDKTAEHIRAALSTLEETWPYLDNDALCSEIARLAFNIQLILSDIQSLKGKDNG